MSNIGAQSADGPRAVGELFEQMPFTRQHLVAGLVLLITFVIESWEMMIIIFNGGQIGAEFGLDTAQIGSLMGSLFLGMIPGALIWGNLVDRFGRRTSVVASLVLYAPIPIICALAPSYEVLWGLRFVGGVILSGLLVATFPFFEELMPVRMRGRATVYLSAGWPLGVLLAIGVTAALSPMGWRWVIAFSAIAGLWAGFAYLLVPESPYWLAEKGRLGEAAKAINRLSGGQSDATPLLQAAGNGAGAAPATPFLAIFGRSALRRTLLQSIVNFCFSWGYWALATWMPALLATRGLSAPEGLSFMALSALFMFPGYIAASYLTGKFGRKPVMLVFVFCAAIAGFGFAYSASMQQMYIWNFTLSFFSLGAWGVWNTWLGEIYSTENRAAGYAWGVTIQRVANSLAPIVIGALLAVASFLETVAFISAFLAISFVTAIFLPETEGKALH